MTQPTSLKAYHTDVLPTLGARQEAVLEAFKHKENFTNGELASFLEWPINTVTPRVFELRQKKILKKYSVRPCKVTGRICIAWEINLELKQVQLL